MVVCAILMIPSTRTSIFQSHPTSTKPHFIDNKGKIFNISMSLTNGDDSKELAPSISVKFLSYSFPDGSSGLKDVVLALPPGSRTLLVGGTHHPFHSLALIRKKNFLFFCFWGYEPEPNR